MIFFYNHVIMRWYRNVLVWEILASFKEQDSISSILTLISSSLVKRLIFRGWDACYTFLILSLWRFIFDSLLFLNCPSSTSRRNVRASALYTHWMSNIYSRWILFGRFSLWDLGNSSRPIEHVVILCINDSSLLFNDSKNTIATCDVSCLFSDSNLF
jgi:hypothetical protein